MTMKLVRRLLLIGVGLLAMGAYGQAVSDPELGSHAPSQAAADALRDFAGTDGAFFAAGLVKSDFQKENLASLLQYPTDTVVVLQLTGAQLRQAFERAISLYPSPNASLLQLSGFEVTFSKSAPSESRVISATLNGAPIDAGKTYTVAMPSSLGRGGLGYFKIWDKSKIVRTYAGASVESVLKGKRFVDSSPRWLAQP